MNVRRLDDPSDFLAAAGPLLLADEARHNLLLGIAGTLRDHPRVYPERRLWLADDGDRVVAAALQTPPFNLVLACPAAEGAVAALADALRDDDVQLPGVTAAIPKVDAFADTWEELTGATRVLRMAQRVYRLVRLRPVGGVPGRTRVATDDDRPLVLAWVRAFARSSGGGAFADAKRRRTVDTRLREAAGGFMLWEDGEPVSLAGWGGETPNGARIGPVYTPPEHRPTRFWERGHGGGLCRAARRRTALLLPLHGSRESDLQPDLHGHRLRAGLRLGRLRVRDGRMTDHELRSALIEVAQPGSIAARRRLRP